MMSTKIQSGRLISGNPFTTWLTPYQVYQHELQGNVQIIKQKYPYEDRNKIKALLEELENNISMVQDIISQEQPKCTQIPQEKIKQQFSLNIKDQNKILKRAFLRLYQRKEKKNKQIQEMNNKIEKLIKQNDNIKMQNKLLLEKQYKQPQSIDDLHIF